MWGVMTTFSIFHSGHSGSNVEMIEKHMGWKWGEDMTSFRIPGIDGDGLNMAWAIGAKKNDVFMEVNYNTPGTTDVFKTLSETMRQPNLMVNLDGSPEALKKKQALWTELLGEHPELYRKLKLFSLAALSNLPGSAAG